MENYDFYGCIIEKKMGLIAVSLPILGQNNDYIIFKTYPVRKNQILIHLKDILNQGPEVDTILHPFIFELNSTEHNLTKKLKAALIHHNADALPEGKTSKQIFDEAYNSVKHPIVTKRVGTGTIRP
jgi:hypothetical protein